MFNTSDHPVSVIVVVVNFLTFLLLFSNHYIDLIQFCAPLVDPFYFTYNLGATPIYYGIMLILCNFCLILKKMSLLKP